MKISKQFSIGLTKYLLRLTITFLSIFGFTCCQSYKKDKGYTTKVPQLNIRTDKASYTGNDELQIEVYIDYEDKNSNLIASYNDVGLRITVNQKGCKGESLIKYTTFDTPTHVTKKQTRLATDKLSHIFKVTDSELIDPSKPLKKTYTILPQGNPKEIHIKYELLDMSNKEALIAECTATWYPSLKPISKPRYELILNSATHIIEAPNPINIEIKKTGGTIANAELNELKLEICSPVENGKLSEAWTTNDKLEISFLSTDIVGQSIKKALPITPRITTEKKYKIQLKQRNEYISTPIIVIYKNAPIGTWQLELVGTDINTKTIHLENTKEIGIEVYKTGELILTPDELKELKLYIRRTTPGNARIATVEDGILELRDIHALILSPDKKSAKKTFIIDSGADKHANFEIQLQDKTGVNLGTPQKVKWGNGAKLLLNAQYDVQTKNVSITVKNAGKVTLPINQATLSWDTGHDTITINGYRQHNEHIKELKSGQEENLILPKVSFADPTNMPSTTLHLTLTWQELEKPLEITCPITVIPIDVTLTTLKFDKRTNQIVYNVENNGNEDIILQLRCINTKSTDPNIATLLETLAIYLNLKKMGDMGSKTGEKRLQVDFKNENIADFKFELLFKGNPINFKYNASDGNGEKEMNQTILTCESKQLKLKFASSLEEDFELSGIELQGDDKKARFRIVLDGNPDEVVALKDIDITKLELSITRTAGDAEIKQGANTVTKIPGNNLNLGEIHTLSIERVTSKQASFIFRLMYDKKGDGSFTQELATLPLTWAEGEKEDKFQILLKSPVAADDLVENEEGIFTLKNITGSIDPKNITVELHSNNQARFCFREFDPTGKEVWGTTTIRTLDKLLGTQDEIASNTESSDILFGLLEFTKEKDAKVTIIVKKDGHEVARTSEPIRWRNKRIDIKIDSIKLGDIPITGNVLVDEGSYRNAAKSFIIALQNNGDTVSTDDIYIQLTNEEELEFKLGNQVEVNSDSDLTDILNLTNFIQFVSQVEINTDLVLTGILNLTNPIQFVSHADKTFNLQIDESRPPIFTKIVLTVKIKNGIPLDQKRLIWINNSQEGLQKYINQANSLKTTFDTIAGDSDPNSFGAILKQATETTDINIARKSFSSVLHKAMLYGFDESWTLKHAENSGMEEVLEKIKCILDDLQKINEQAKTTNNGIEVEVIKQAVNNVQTNYNRAKETMQRKTTEVAQKLLEVINTYMERAHIDKQPSGEAAKQTFYIVFNELKPVLDDLLNQVSLYYIPKTGDQEFSLAIKGINNIFAKNYRIIASKYERENNNSRKEEYIRWAKSCE